MDDRIALRLGALRLARRRGRTRDAAWAAARLRLAGVNLAPGEARFAREMRVKLGHALRSARIRRGRPIGLTAATPMLLAEPRSRRRRIIAAAVAAVLLLGALLLYVRLQEPAGAPAGAPPAQQAVIATPPPPLRGRTEPGVAAAAPVVVVTAAPAEGPPATPGTGTAGGGTGGGGSGGGTGNGNGRGTPAPTPKPTPTPTPTPTPQPTVASSLVYVHGRVANVYSPYPAIPGVCISIGNLDCSLSPHTDANGEFVVVLDSRSASAYSLRFIMNGYVTRTVVIRLPLPPPADIGTITLTPQ
jgi:hypothetical protein